MSGPLTVIDGSLVSKDPSDIIVYTFDWDAKHLAQGVTISTYSVTVTGISGDITTTPLTKTTDGLLSGNRKVFARISAGAVGSRWMVSCFIVTNETPDQRFERSFFIKVEDR